VVVLSHRYWKARFGGDPSVGARPWSLNGHPFEVIGVVEERFNGLRPRRSGAALRADGMQPQMGRNG
jgi:hypothetical protein